MKAIIEFNLPEEDRDFRLAANAGKVVGAIYDIREDMRIWLKHGHTFKTADEALEAVRKQLIDVLDQLDP